MNEDLVESLGIGGVAVPNREFLRSARVHYGPHSWSGLPEQAQLSFLSSQPQPQSLAFSTLSHALVER